MRIAQNKSNTVQPLPTLCLPSANLCAGNQSHRRPLFNSHTPPPPLSANLCRKPAKQSHARALRLPAASCLASPPPSPSPARSLSPAAFPRPGRSGRAGDGEQCSPSRFSTHGDRRGTAGSTGRRGGIVSCGKMFTVLLVTVLLVGGGMIVSWGKINARALALLFCRAVNSTRPLPPHRPWRARSIGRPPRPSDRGGAHFFVALSAPCRGTLELCEARARVLFSPLLWGKSAEAQFPARGREAYRTANSCFLEVAVVLTTKTYFSIRSPTTRCIAARIKEWPFSQLSRVGGRASVAEGPSNISTVDRTGMTI